MNTEFSSCTKETLHSLINRAKKGKIDLNDYWKIGDERSIIISKDKVANLKEDLEIRCVLARISKYGLNQKIDVISNIFHVPDEFRTELSHLLVETIKEEFGQDEIVHELIPQYCVNDAKWTSEQTPQLYGSVNLDDIKWNIGKKRTVPDFLDKFGVV